MQKKEQFEMLFRSHYEPMLMLAKLLLKDDEEAKDVVSDIFTDIWEGTIHLSDEWSKNYLLMCVHNRCLDLLRHRKLKERVSQLLTLDTSSIMMPDRNYHPLELERIREMVDTRLTSRDRQILLMKYERKMKYHEMATELGISEAAVYKHLSNALKTLKDNFKDE